MSRKRNSLRSTSSRTLSPSRAGYIIYLSLQVPHDAHRNKNNEAPRPHTHIQQIDTCAIPRQKKKLKKFSPRQRTNSNRSSTKLHTHNIQKTTHGKNKRGKLAQLLSIVRCGRQTTTRQSLTFTPPKKKSPCSGVVGSSEGTLLRDTRL